MDNSFIRAFEIISVLFAAFDFYYAYKSYKQSEEMGRFLGAAAFSAGIVVICYLFSIRPGTYRSASVASSLYFCGIDWMLVSLTHFIFLYTGRHTTKFSRAARILIRVVAAIDSMIMLINIFSEIAIHYKESETGVVPYVYEMKPLYVAHLIFTYLLVAFIMYILVAKTISTPVQYRNQYFLIIITIGLVVILNAIFLFSLGNGQWGKIDVSILLYSIGLYFTYWAAFEYRFRYMPRVLSMTIFDNIGQGLALFDNEDELIMHNRKADVMLGMDLPARMPAKKLMEHLQLPAPEQGKDRYSIQCEKNSRESLRCDYTRFRDERGGVVGNLYVFTDSSNDVDILTGYQTWEKFRQSVEDNPEFILPPATAIVFDITGLGELNRRFGHETGDQKIGHLAKRIKEFIPEGAIFVRGYEANLLALLPGRWECDVIGIAEKILEDSENTILYGISDFNYLTDTCDYSLDSDEFVISESSGNIKRSIMDTIRVAMRDLQVKKLLDSHSIHSQTLTSLIKALQESDSETEAHVQRTQKMGGMLGKRIGLSDAQLSDLRLLCLLHDIGKIGIPLEILNKPGRLSGDEWAVLRTHPSKGFQICMSTEELRPIARMVLCHHERWDGKGYPEGIQGEEIPILSRVISIVDAYDAMVNDRPYRKGLSVEAAKEEIRRCSGTQFDPVLATEFLTLLAEHPEIAEGERTGAREVGIFLQAVSEGNEFGNTYPVKYSHYILDIDEHIEEVDDEFTELTGYSREEALNMVQFDLIPPEDRQHYILMVSNQFSKGNVVFLEHDILRKDGERITVLCMGKKYYDSAQKVYRSDIFITAAVKVV